jgi:hypothetical protein
VLIRLLSRPKPGELDEFDLSPYRPGGVYDLPTRLATILMIGGHATSVAAERDTAADSRPARKRRAPQKR